MKVAVIIPFRGDAGTLRWALEGFAEQVLPEGVELEVRVCADGVALPALPPDRGSIRFRGVAAEHSGVAGSKNRLLRGWPADVAIMANADTRPVPGFVGAHVGRLLALPEGSMVLGAAPYEHRENPTVFDALIEETPMIFFYSELRGGASYDFRHGWNLNVSMRYADLERAGFFAEALQPYGYEDLDLGFKMMGPERRGVYFEPSATVTHRHPMTFEQYLDREELLGIMAVVLQSVNPVLFAWLHGGGSLERVAEQFRDWTHMDEAMHRWIFRRMNEWVGLPASTLGEGDGRRRFLGTLYQMHVPLKRLAFRLGFLRGLELREAQRWKERRAEGLWRKAVSP